MPPELDELLDEDELEELLEDDEELEDELLDEDELEELLEDEELELLEDELDDVPVVQPVVAPKELT